MFGIGGGELVLIAFVALIVFGPQRIPELARAAARGYRELTRLRKQVDETLNEVKRDLQLESELAALKTEIPLIRPPQGERANAAATTLAKAGATGNPETTDARIEALAFPDEDDYLAQPGAQGGPT